MDCEFYSLKCNSVFFSLQYIRLKWPHFPSTQNVQCKMFSKNGEMNEKAMTIKALL